jgi:hypothetical protein
VPGEAITVSVVLSSDDFQYIPLENSIVHYFAPSTTIPVDIVGSVSGAFQEVSPIARFVALELEESTTGGDSLALDVAAGTAGTSLLSLSTNGSSGFDGNVTPHSSEDLFALFAGAMNDQGFWAPSASSAVFVGADPELLFLGQLQWSLVDSMAGDADADGDVDGQDFLVWQRTPASATLADWQKNYGMSVPDGQTLKTLGDFNEDGDVDGRDFLLWQRDPSRGRLSDWQASFGSTAWRPATQAVPEPSSGVLAAICGLLFVARLLRRAEFAIV